MLRTPANSYRDLVVWQKSMDLVEYCYRLAKLLPREEIYGLSSQIRRAAVSIPSNIAEGYGRKSRNSYTHFLSISQGSLKELETHLILCHRLQFVEQEKVEAVLIQCDEVGRILNVMITKLEQETP